MDLNEENIIFKNMDFSSLADFKFQNSQNYFSNKDFLSESDLEEIYPNLKINTELFDFDRKNLNEINATKGKNSLKDLNDDNLSECKFIQDKKYFETIQLKIKENILSKKPFKEKKILGRRKKNENVLGEHNKYSDDNIIRKCKNIILNSVFTFINKKIKHLYFNEAQEFEGKKLLKLKQNQSLKSRTSYNKSFLKSTLKMIFSEDISSKYSKYSRTHNKELIESLMKEKDKRKREIFIDIFSLTFGDCLNHFRGSDFCDKLEGMRGINEYINDKDINNKEEEYYYCFKYVLNNYERIIMEKKERKYRKK